MSSPRALLKLIPDGQCIKWLVLSYIFILSIGYSRRPHKSFASYIVERFKVFNCNCFA